MFRNSFIKTLAVLLKFSFCLSLFNFIQSDDAQKRQCAASQNSVINLRKLLSQKSSAKLFVLLTGAQWVTCPCAQSPTHPCG